MQANPKRIKPATRALGAIICGAGTYFAAHWFNAWELSDAVINSLSIGMAFVGFAFGPKVWDLIIHFV